MLASPNHSFCSIGGGLAEVHLPLPTSPNRRGLAQSLRCWHSPVSRTQASLMTRQESEKFPGTGGKGVGFNQPFQTFEGNLTWAGFDKRFLRVEFESLRVPAPSVPLGGEC
eukprot:EG_transcript_61801